MRLRTLVDEVLDEGDELWVETGEGRFEGVYDGYEMRGDKIRVYFEEEVRPGRDYFTVSDSDLYSGNDFGVKGEGSVYEAVRDYGLYGEQVNELLGDASENAGKLKAEINVPEKKPVTAD